MSLQKFEQTDVKNQYELTIFIDHETFEAAIQKVYQKEVKKITVHGFRKGKAPRSIVEKMYGKGVFYEQAIDDILPVEYPKALEESKLNIVSRPEFDIKTIDDNGVTLKAKVFVKPEVTVENYKGIAVDRSEKPVTAEDVDAEIKTVQERNSRTIEISDRPAQMDDLANIDYEGTVDGVAFDGGSAKGYDLKLGSGSFIPGFEEQIVGHAVGESFDVNVTFPEEYHAENLKGKAAVFAVKLNALKVNELPELDDEFAKDVSDFETFAEYKADVETKAKERNAKQADNAVENALMEKLMALLVADIPECMFEAETENQVRDFDNRLRMQGLDLSTYFKYTGLDLDKMREQLRPQAENQVKLRLALEKIAELENCEASEEEIEAEYKRIAEQYGVEIEQVKSSIESADIAADLKVKKAVDLVKASAIVTEVPYEEKKPETAEVAETADEESK